MYFDIFHNIFLLIYSAFLFLIFLGLTYIATVRTDTETYDKSDRHSVLVIVPCRGHDYELEANLKSIAGQKYPDFRVVAVVDSADDDAASFISASGIEMLVSEQVCNECSGKVRAIATALEKYPGYDLFVIADSDIRVKEDWLQNLVSPFENQKVGLSTTFPYFNPVGGFWSRVKLVWGFVGLGMMESKLTRFGWGGSLAFRTSLLDETNLKFFKSYVSDDIALTKICKSSGMEMAYVRDAMPVINSPDSREVFVEWANRQTALSIYATRNVFYYGVLFYGASILLFISAVSLGIVANPLYFIFLIPTLANSVRSVQRAGKMGVFTFFLSMLIPFIYFYNLVKANSMKSITWRGRNYSLK